MLEFGFTIISFSGSREENFLVFTHLFVVGTTMEISIPVQSVED